MSGMSSDRRLRENGRRNCYTQGCYKDLAWTFLYLSPRRLTRTRVANILEYSSTELHISTPADSRLSLAATVVTVPWWIVLSEFRTGFC